MYDVQALATLEDILASHRGFGDSDYLQGEMRSRHETWLAEIADRMPAAGRLLSALGSAETEVSYRALGATVTRCAIQHAYTGLTAKRLGALSISDCEQILAVTAELVEGGEVGALPLDAATTYANRVGDQPRDGAAWTEGPEADVLTRGLNTVIRHNYGDLPIRPAVADLEHLRAGVRLLRNLVPRLADSTLSHAHLVAVVPDQGRWRGTGSSSQFRLAGMVFLSQTLLEDPWTVAEQLLHESLHQKLYDFRFGHTMFRPVDPSRPAARVCSPWNSFDTRKGNYWDTFRVFAAFHVYVHLTFLAHVAQARCAESPDLAGILDSATIPQRVRAATVRARYLGEQLATEPCWTELGPAGHALHRWLTSVLDALDPDPPPAGAALHLMLDLYRKEAARVRSSERALDAAELGELLAAEVAQSRALLLALGTAPQDVGLDRAPTTGPTTEPDELASEFYRVRGQIAEALSRHLADGYRLAGPPVGGQDPDTVARHMVEASSQRLSEMFAHAAATSRRQGPGSEPVGARQ